MPETVLSWQRSFLDTADGGYDCTHIHRPGNSFEAAGTAVVGASINASKEPCTSIYQRRCRSAMSGTHSEHRCRSTWIKQKAVYNTPAKGDAIPEVLLTIFQWCKQHMPPSPPPPPHINVILWRHKLFSGKCLQSCRLFPL